MTNPKLLRTCPVIIMVAILVGCSATPSAPRNPTVSDATSNQIDALEAAGDYPGAARLYLSLRGTPAELREWRLRAAEAYREGNDLAQAAATLDSLNAALLDTDQRTRAGIIRADAALDAGQPAEALDQMPTLTPEIQGERRIEILTLRIAAYRGVGSNVDAMLDALQLQRLVADGERRRAVEDDIWALLDTLDPEEAQSLASLDPSLPGWIVLHDIAAISLARQSEFETRISAWQRDFPIHPGSERATQLSLARSNPTPPAQVGLLLPLSDRYAAAADVVRDGFLLGSFLAAEPRPEVRVYDVSGLDPAQVYLQAAREGADLVVGPLLKHNVEKLAQLEGRPVPLLALNRVGDPTGMAAVSADEIPGEPSPDMDAPPIGGNGVSEEAQLSPPETPKTRRPFAAGAAIYQFGLAPEDDAEEAARRANAEGLRRALVLYPDNDWGRRIEKAFRASFEQGGGFVAGVGPYDPTAADFSAPIQMLLHLDTSQGRRRALEKRLGTKLEFEPRRREDADLIFLAALPNQGRQVYPQLRFYHLGDLPTWATADLYAGGADPVRNRDLDGVEFSDIPWLLGRQRLEPELQGEDILLDPAMRDSRLFALGLDAYRLMPWLPALSSAPSLSIDGATGRLSIDAERVVHRRDLVWAQFRDGIAQPLGGTALESSSMEEGETSPALQ